MFKISPKQMDPSKTYPSHHPPLFLFLFSLTYPYTWHSTPFPTFPYFFPCFPRLPYPHLSLIPTRHHLSLFFPLFSLPLVRSEKKLTQNVLLPHACSVWEAWMVGPTGPHSRSTTTLKVAQGSSTWWVVRITKGGPPGPHSFQKRNNSMLGFGF